jgi:cytochrome c
MKFLPWSLACLGALATAIAQETQTPTTGTGGGGGSPNWMPPESDFREVVLDQDQVVNGVATDTIVDPMELAVAKDGRVFWAERKGVVKVWSPSTKATTVIANIPVFDGLEEGMLGITLDPKFLENGWIYLNHSLTETFNDGQGKAGKIRVSRYTFNGTTLDVASEKVIIEMQVQRQECCHVGGSLTFDAAGNLYVSIGDNTNPFASDGYSPSDEQPGRYPWDAQRSAANSNVLVGKILRIKPKPEGGYDIPEGNLFKPGTPKTRPEIYVMGNRNPFRISVDQKTGYLYWGEVGPDAGENNPDRGPTGHDEVNQARGPGFFGWPYFVGDNKAYRHWDFAKKVAGAAWDPAHPINRSPNNTGIEELPPAQPAFIWYPPGLSTRFPVMGSGGRTAMAGPVYYYDANLKSEHKFPKAFDHTFFVYEWSRNTIIAVKLDADDHIAKDRNGKLMMARFMPHTLIQRPMDIEQGPDGCLYVIEYGKEWGNNKDTKILRLEYTGQQ